MKFLSSLNYESNINRVYRLPVLGSDPDATGNNAVFETANLNEAAAEGQVDWVEAGQKQKERSAALTSSADNRIQHAQNVVAGISPDLDLEADTKDVDGDGVNENIEALRKQRTSTHAEVNQSIDVALASPEAAPVESVTQTSAPDAEAGMAGGTGGDVSEHAV